MHKSIRQNAVKINLLNIEGIFSYWNINFEHIHTFLIYLFTFFSYKIGHLFSSCEFWVYCWLNKLMFLTFLQETNLIETNLQRKKDQAANPSIFRNKFAFICFFNLFWDLQIEEKLIKSNDFPDSTPNSIGRCLLLRWSTVWQAYQI